VNTRYLRRAFFWLVTTTAVYLLLLGAHIAVCVWTIAYFAPTSIAFHPMASSR